MGKDDLETKNSLCCICLKRKNHWVTILNTYQTLLLTLPILVSKSCGQPIPAFCLITTCNCSVGGKILLKRVNFGAKQVWLSSDLSYIGKLMWVNSQGQIDSMHVTWGKNPRRSEFQRSICGNSWTLRYRFAIFCGEFLSHGNTDPWSGYSPAVNLICFPLNADVELGDCIRLLGFPKTSQPFWCYQTFGIMDEVGWMQAKIVVGKSPRPGRPRHRVALLKLLFFIENISGQVLR